MKSAEVADVGVVIVTHEPSTVLGIVLERLLDGIVVPEEVVIVDSGSSNPSALQCAKEQHPGITVVYESDNVGFCVANNMGTRSMGRRHEFILYLNPDALVTSEFLRDGCALLENHRDIGALNPKLLKVDPATLIPTGTIDCAGIFQTAYGRVYDRGQGDVDRGQYDGPAEDVPALCAAAMLCRLDALDQAAVDGQIFDESFFMFKEDLDLSYRLHAAGWRTVLASELLVHHCRGHEQRTRSSIPTWVRRRSLANEWRLWRKSTLPPRLRIPMFVYLVAKSVAVRFGR